MLALFNYGDGAYCGVIVADNDGLIAYGARKLGGERLFCWQIAVTAESAGEIDLPYGESETFGIPFGMASYTLPAGTVQPGEK